MVFSSFTFLCFFLPVVFLLHTVIGNTRVRNLLLMAASLVFYAYGEPIYILLLLFSAAVNWLLGLGLGKNRSKGLVALAVIFNIGLLVIFKYTGFLLGELNRLLPAAGLPVPKIVLPIGISFYTFQILSYVLDVYRGDVKVQKNFCSLLLYISFFPQLIAGPIVKYHEVEEQIENRRVTADEVRKGIYRFCCGLGKKILIANGMAVIADTLYGMDPGSLGLLSGWMMALAYYFQIYFDFSGYSDMAIGLGKMFGFRFRENFNYPYISVSVKDFWRRWHISLSTWFREYLYIPLGGNRRGKGRTYFNLYIVFLATGIWHGANWTFLLWGLYHGTFLVLERLGVIPVEKLKMKLPGILYANLAALFGWVLFRADSVAQAWAVVKAMFGGGTAGGAAYGAALPFLSPYYICLFVLAAVGSTPLVQNSWNRLRAKTEGRDTAALLFELCCMLGCVAVILLSFMQLASDSYNPFIYFRF